MATAAAVERRSFEPSRDARRGVFVTATGKLMEVVAVKGQPPKEAWQRPGANAAVKLLDCAEDLPFDPFEEIDRAEWMPLVVAEKSLRVVEPSAADS